MEFWYPCSLYTTQYGVLRNKLPKTLRSKSMSLKILYNVPKKNGERYGLLYRRSLLKLYAKGGGENKGGRKMCADKPRQIISEKK